MIDLDCSAPTLSLRAPRSCFLLALCACLLVSPAVAEERSSASLTPDLARQLVEELVPVVERLRGLEFREPVPVQVIDDARARDHVIRRLDAFQSDGRLAGTRRAYELLGLWPAGTDVMETLLEALRDQAGGFYDPDTGSYYLLDDLPTVLAPAVTAHELTHALEDQYFDLDAGLRAVLDDDDQLFARSAVHEGSAVLIMTVFMAERALAGELDMAELQAQAEHEAERAASLSSMPAVMLRQMLGTYVLGAEFLMGGKLTSLVSRGYPADEIERAYRDRPLSSEQILHPHKYWDPGRRDDPVRVELAEVGEQLGPGWERRSEGVLGELVLAVLVGADTPMNPRMMFEGVGQAWVHPAAAGWGGDRWELWSRGGRSVVLLSTVWDTEQDAQEFAEAIEGLRGLRARRSRHTVAVVAGEIGRKKARSVLARLVAAEAVSRLVPDPRNR